MKTSPGAEYFRRAFVLLGLLSIAASCADDEQTSSQTVAQFNEPTLSLSESDGQQIIDINLDQPAPSTGDIILTVNSVVAACIVTEPPIVNGQLKLSLSQSRNFAYFKIAPVDNKDLDGCKVIKFSITSLPKGYRKGSTTDLTVSVNDDESPVTAGFEEEGLSIRENNPDGGKINIAFATPAPADGLLVFRFSSKSNYGTQYLTEPVSVNGKIIIQVAKGATSASMRVIPVNDNIFSADRNISVELLDATGGLEVGDKTSFWCTITEDDGQEISAIVQVRQMLGADQVILHDTYVEGIVTSISNISGGRIVVEDATGALPIQLEPDHNLTRGDVVLVNLDHGLLHWQQGVLEVKDVTAFQKLGEESLQISKLSLNELLQSTDRKQSQTVQLLGVSFQQANGTTTFLGDKEASDGQNFITIRTVAGAEFSSELIPSGLINVTGIFVNIDGQNYLYPQAITDIKKQQQPAAIKGGSTIR